MLSAIPLSAVCDNINFLINHWRIEDEALPHLQYNEATKKLEYRDQEISSLFYQLSKYFLYEPYEEDIWLIGRQVATYQSYLKREFDTLSLPDPWHTSIMKFYRDLYDFQCHISLQLTIRKKMTELRAWLYEKSIFQTHSQSIFQLDVMIYNIDQMIDRLRRWQLAYMLNVPIGNSLENFSHFPVKWYHITQINDHNRSFVIQYSAVPQTLPFSNTIYIWDYFPSSGEIDFRIRLVDHALPIAVMRVAIKWVSPEGVLLNAVQYLKAIGDNPSMRVTLREYVLHAIVMPLQNNVIESNYALTLFKQMGKEMLYYNKIRGMIFESPEKMEEIVCSRPSSSEKEILTAPRAWLPLHLGVGRVMLPSFSALRERAYRGRGRKVFDFLFTQTPFDMHIVKNRELRCHYGQLGQQDWRLPVLFAQENFYALREKDDPYALWNPGPM